MIQKLADKSSEKLNWNQSIVDLMKLLQAGQQPQGREQLAKELGYTGALDGSAEMRYLAAAGDDRSPRAAGSYLRACARLKSLGFNCTRGRTYTNHMY
jgi:hypothetical protein